MGMNSNPFSPGATASQAVSGSSATKALGSGSGLVVLVQNDATATAFFKFGVSTITAATTDTPILAGQSQTFTIDAASTHFAVIGTSGTLYVTRGSGS